LLPDPTQRPSAKDVLRFVDLSIRKILASVSRVLPIPDQQAITGSFTPPRPPPHSHVLFVASVDQLRSSRSGEPVQSEQQQQQAEVADLLQSMYTHMLAKKPQEVDELILKATSGQ